MSKLIKFELINRTRSRPIIQNNGLVTKFDGNDSKHADIGNTL